LPAGASAQPPQLGCRRRGGGDGRRRPRALFAALAPQLRLGDVGPAAAAVSERVGGWEGVGAKMWAVCGEGGMWAWQAPQHCWHALQAAAHTPPCPGPVPPPDSSPRRPSRCAGLGCPSAHQCSCLCTPTRPPVCRHCQVKGRHLARQLHRPRDEAVQLASHGLCRGGRREGRAAG
jgi:hypothetical protein